MPAEMNPRFTEHPIEWTDEKVSRLWNYYARTPPYSEIYFSKVHGRDLLRLAGLPLNQPLKVLDFGCGPGFIWDHLQALGARWTYTGLDFSPDSVRRLADRAQGQSLFDGAHHVASLPSMLPDTHFDAVFLFEVVEHLGNEHLEGTLLEATRLLKRGGVIVVSTPNEENIDASKLFCPECGAIFHQWQHVRSWSVATLAEKLKAYNLALREAHTVDLAPAGLLRRAVRRVRSLVQGKRHAPHMVAIFQKS